MDLFEKTCVPCKGGVPALSGIELNDFMKQVDRWNLDGPKKKISKSVKVPDFKQSIELANEIGEIAESQGHHPDLLVRWGELKIEVWTHKIDGLTESDFILAAKIDQLIKSKQAKIR